MFEILSVRRHSNFLFTVRSAAAWPPVPQPCQQLISTMLCPAFLRTFLCQPLWCLSFRIQTFYQNLVLVAEYHVDLLTNTAVTSAVTSFRCHNIDRKSKQVKDQRHGKFYLQSVWEKTRYFKHLKYQNLWTNNKEAIKMQFVCVFFHICGKFEFLISKGSVATCPRWGW